MGLAARAGRRAVGTSTEEGLPVASIILVGDELLQGHVRDVHAAWLARELRRVGVLVEGVQIVPDHPVATGGTVRREIERGGPRVVLTVGGLGPTPDDVTYDAVARAFDVPLVHSPDMAVFVHRWADRDGCSTAALQAMLRMAMLPRGAEVLGQGQRGPVAVLAHDGGWRTGGTSVVMLPGVADHLRAAFRDVVSPVLLPPSRSMPSQSHLDIVHELPEAELRPAFHLVECEGEGLTLGSYPGPPHVLRLSGPAGAVERVGDALRRQVETLGRERAPLRTVLAGGRQVPPHRSTSAGSREAAW